MKKIYSFLILMLFAICCTTFFGCNEININSSDVSFMVGFNKTSLEYNGKNQLPLIAYAKVNGEVISSSHYEISAPDCKEVGKYNAKIVLKNVYSGIYYKEFSIVPKKISLNRNKISFNSKSYVKDDRSVIFSDSTVFELVGVAEGDDVQLDDSKAYAMIKTKNVDAGVREVQYVGFEIKGKDARNYELVIPNSTISISKASQEKPVLGEDFSVDVFKNKIVVNKLCSEDLEYKLENNKTTSTFSNKTVFTELLEDTSYTLYVRKPSSTNYLSSSYTYVQLKTNTIDISLTNVNGSDEVVFESGDSYIKRQENELKWKISGVLPMVSQKQKDNFNNSNYDYFLPINLQLKNNSSNKDVNLMPDSVSYSISDGVANTEGTKVLDENHNLQLVLGISKSMLENGSFSITVTWGTEESETYEFDISELKEPSEVRLTSIKKNISTFDSLNIKINQEDENIKEYTLSGKFEKLTANQSRDLGENYNYFVSLRFENATVDFTNATIQLFDFVDGSYVAVFDEPVSLDNYKTNSQFAVNLIKGLNLNQTSFKVLIVWNNENSAEYIFNISNNSIFESIKNVDENNALTLAGCTEEFFNNSSIKVLKNDNGTYSVTGNANVLTESQCEVYDATNKDFIIFFFESKNVGNVQVKKGEGEYISVEDDFKNANGFYQILEVSEEIQSINFSIKWNENIIENYLFEISMKF